MCLIITGTASKLRETLLHTPGLVEDIFKTNPDGIGIMYASRRGLRVFKALPKSVSAAKHFLSRMPGDGRNLAIHFRWTTHGHTNKDNCHPYTIVPGKAAMMHNGVLRTGNSADRSRSDTWHFIEDYLKRTVEMAPMIVHDNGYKLLVKDFIGSGNRFVFMTEDGTMSVINAGQGVEHEGLWFSNTYAWTPGILIESERKHNGYGGSSYQGSSFRSHHSYPNGFVDDDYSDQYDSAYGFGGAQSGGTKSTAHVAGSGTSLAIVHNNGVTKATRFDHRKVHSYTKEDEQEEQAWRETVAKSRAGWSTTGAQGGSGAGAAKKGPALWTAASSHNVVPVSNPLKSELQLALSQSDVDTVCAWLLAHPRTTIHMLFNCFVAAPTKWTNRMSLDADYTEVYDMCVGSERLKLISYVERDINAATRVAEVVCYYLDWLDFYEALRRRQEVRNTPPDATRRTTVINGVAVASTELANRIGLPHPGDEADDPPHDMYAG